MSESLAVAGPRAAEQGRPAALDPRRKLQLGLAVLWLFDGILQYQPAMFGTSFPRMLADSAQGNPAVVAGPVTWSAGFIDHHLAVLNAVFATVQVALGLGIAFRPTVRLALAASVAWSLSVWWLGEGLGGILAGTASPVNGAPGAVILYAVLAVLLWPAGRRPAGRRLVGRCATGRHPAGGYAAAPFVAAGAIGVRAARAAWLVIWASLAAFALLPASRAPQAISGMISDMASGQPGWLSWLGRHTASLLAGQGLLASILLAAACVIVAAGPYLPFRAARAAIVLAIVAAAFIWLAQGLGQMFTGGATDPNSGPLLALLALSFWPLAAARPDRDPSLDRDPSPDRDRGA